MSVQIIAAIASFVVLFAAWVIIPTQLKKRHENKAGSETKE
jgi:hypothetical protein